MVRSKQTSVYLTPDEADKLAAQAQAENRTLSNLLRVLILRAMGNETKPDKPASKSQPASTDE